MLGKNVFSQTSELQFDSSQFINFEVLFQQFYIWHFFSLFPCPWGNTNANGKEQLSPLQVLYQNSSDVQGGSFPSKCSVILVAFNSCDSYGLGLAYLPKV